jgi:hypothetical protein
MARSALLVNIIDDDEKWALQQNRWNCAVVRSVQRAIPEALYVTADKDAVCFSIPEDGEDGIRYTFDPPPLELLKAFDLKREIPEEFRSFTIVARDAKPMKHVKRDRHANAAKKRIGRTNDRQRATTRSKNPVTHTTNRFLDAEAAE